MELGYGLGIGLQVRPKDYVELVKSRDAAQAKGQAAKKAAADKTLERTYERFTKEVGGARVLPVNQSMYDSNVDDFYRMVEEESTKDTPNYNKVNEQLFKTRDAINNLAAQYKQFETLSNDAEKFGIPPDELQQIRTEKDPEKLNKWITENGTGTFQLDNSSGVPMLVSRPIEYTPIKKTFDTYAQQTRLFNDKNAGSELTEKIGPSTIKYYGMNPAAKDAFVYGITTSPAMYESAAKEYRSAMRGKPKPIPGSPEEKEAVIKFTEDTYKTLSLPLLLRDEYSDRRTIVNVNTVPPKERGDAPSIGLEYRNIYGNLSLGTQARWGIGETAFTGGITKGTRNADTGEEVKSSGGKIESGELIIAPVATKNLRLSYVNPVNGQSMKFDYVAGDPIPKELEVEALKQGGVTYNKLAMATYTPSSGAPMPVIIPPGTTVNNAYGKLDAKEKPAFDKILRDLNTNLAKFNTLDKAFQAQLMEKYKDFDTIFQSEEYKGQRQSLGKPKDGTTTEPAAAAPTPANAAPAATGTGAAKPDFTLYQEYKKNGGKLSLMDWKKANKPTK